VSFFSVRGADPSSLYLAARSHVATHSRFQAELLRGLFDRLLEPLSEDPRGIEVVIYQLELLLEEQCFPRTLFRSFFCFVTGTPADAIADADDPCDAFLVVFLGEKG
jgi:hypothetical protein